MYNTKVVAMGIGAVATTSIDQTCVQNIVLCEYKKSSEKIMLSKRDKLLIQPWEKRRYKDHREKVKCALPAIDDKAPKKMPHVTTKLKKRQKEEERKGKIEKDNFSLLQRLSAVMKCKRLDNHWKNPLPNFHNKVGLYYTVGTSCHSNFNEVTPTSDESHQRSCDTKSNRCSACYQNKERFKGSSTKDIHQFSLSNSNFPSI